MMDAVKRRTRQAATMLSFRRSALPEETMHLTPKELERLTIFTVAEMARRRRARGLKLNLPETIGLLCDEMMEAARDGRTFDQVVAVGMNLLHADDVMPGVPVLLDLVQLEPQFEDGTKLVTLRYPLGDHQPGVGEVRFAEGEIALNEGRARQTLSVHNPTPYPIQVTSHLHFASANPALQFDRALAAGMHLDVPAGGSVRWEPGDTHTVDLVTFGGAQAQVAE
jgi:urease subunit gamma/beta